jgi:hypothetical protein
MFWNHVNKKLSPYLHGELSADEARRVAEHLKGCPACRAEYEEIKFGAQLASQLTLDQAPESLWGELETALNRGDASRLRNSAAAPLRLFFGVPAFKFATALATLLLIGGVGLWLSRQKSQPEVDNRPSWEVTRLEGQPAIGKQQIEEKGRLPLGESLTTDGESRAQISVGQIGEVKVEPNSIIRLVEASGDQHRLALSRGKMEAFIWAPPRQFFVDTPSAVAVDLGCSYTLEVDDQGVGSLRVTLGWVAFESKGRESFVPADAMCLTRPNFGPGTPFFSDASQKLREGLARFDVSTTTEDGQLALRENGLSDVLAEARKRDALTLWHLLSRTIENERGRVFDRLAQLIPPPPVVTRAGVLNGERAMLDAWWDKLELGDTSWWRMWKGPPPK